LTALVRSPGASALKPRLSVTIAHRQLVSRVPDNGNLGRGKARPLVDFAIAHPP
jgi:hypothetical protein